MWTTRLPHRRLMIKITVLLSALSGAVSSLVFETKISFFRALILITAGATCAIFTHPILHHYLNVPEVLSPGTAFIFGLLSMKVAAILYRVLDMIRENPSIVLKYVRDKFTPRNPV